MKRKITAPIFAAALLLSNGITAFAAPEVINVGGVRTVFDAEYYASANPDVAAVIGTDRDALVQHYTAYGKAENRPAYAPDTDVNALLGKKKRKSETVMSSDGRLEEYKEYDKHGNLLSQTHAYDGKTDTITYINTYEEHDNVLTVTTTGTFSNGRTWLDSISTCTYDAQGNLLSRTYSDGYKIKGYTYTYTYDAQGNVMSRTVISPQGEIRTYDKQGNDVSLTTPDGETIDLSPYYTYDEHGNLLSYTDPRGFYSYNNTYTYDAQGNVLSRVKTTDGGYTGTETYTYDEHGNLLSHTDAYGETVTYTYF